MARSKIADLNDPHVLKGLLLAHIQGRMEPIDMVRDMLDRDPESNPAVGEAVLLFDCKSTWGKMLLDGMGRDPQWHSYWWVIFPVSALLACPFFQEQPANEEVARADRLSAFLDDEQFLVWSLSKLCEIN